MGLLSKATLKQNSILRPSVKADVRVFIENYAKTSGSFHCIVLKSDAETTSGMVSHLGSVLALENGSCLVLVPVTMDRQLLAHRISGSLSAAVLCQCAAESASEAIKILASFL